MTMPVIQSIGVASPGTVLAQDAALAAAIERAAPDPDHTRRLRALYRRSGVASRATVLNSFDAFYPAIANKTAARDGANPSTRERMRIWSREAPLLALAAAQDAITRASADTDEAARSDLVASITHVITVSCTGFDAPGVEIALIKSLGIRRDAARLNLGFMGCHGAMNGLRAASDIVRAHPSARVLLVTVELCSLHFAYGNRADDIVANAIFGDGAAAALVCSSESGAVAGVVDGPAARWAVIDHFSTIVDDDPDESQWGGENAMAWAVGDHGFQMTLSARVPGIIESTIRNPVDAWLRSNGVSVAGVDLWAVHPGGSRVLDAVEAALSLEPEKLAASRAVLNEHGNMSSSTVLFVGQRLGLDRSSEAQSGSLAVMIAFGPGLSIEATLCRCI